jgi:hypothetical protein
LAKSEIEGKGMNNTFGRSGWCLGLLLALAMACGDGGSSSSGGGTSIPVAPAFTIQPTSQTVAVGQTATFTVVATGTPPLSYQWYQSIGNSTSQWNAIPSATSNNYTTPVTILSNSGSNFEVYIENAAGNAFSDMATLTVNAEPVINSFTAYPTMIPRGSPATLSWSVSGATGLSIDQGVGTVTGTSISVSPTTTTTYTLTAFGATGTIEVNAQVEVTVGASTYFTGNFLAWTGPSVINPKYPFELIRINGTTGLITAIGGQDNFNGLVYGINGELYGISDHLAIINPATGATSNPVNLTYNGGSPILMCAASISPSGQLYVLEDVSPGRIFEVNMASGALTLVGTAPGLAQTIGFGYDGTLYTGFNELYKLNILNTFSVKDLGSLGFSPLVCIIALSPGAGGILYAMDFQGACIYSINPTVPSATVVATVGGNASEWITAFVAEQ